MNKYCVYIHKRQDNGEVFYVGHGTIRRPSASCKYTRSRAWLSVVDEAGGFCFEIVSTNLSKTEAQNLELDLIIKYPNLINSKTNRNPREIELNLILDKFAYNELSPSCLIWKKTGKSAGSVSTINNKQYWKVRIDGRSYRVHRLIVLLNGLNLTKDLVVDHLDGNSLNNKLSNLRVCTQEENMQFVNTKNSEIQGVSYNKVYKYWVARWQENGTQRSKTFSIKKFGFDVAKQLALEHRRSKIESSLGSLT